MVNVRKWDIWLCGFDPTEGSEQRGKRPALVISNDAINEKLNVCTVLPLTSVKPETVIHRSEIFLPTDISGLNKDSLVLSHQIRTVSQTRLVAKLSTLTNTKHRAQVLKACRELIEY